jgi:hypothetical protein
MALRRAAVLTFEDQASKVRGFSWLISLVRPFSAHNSDQKFRTGAFS